MSSSQDLPLSSSFVLQSGMDHPYLAQRLRLMCSYGGEFVLRPHDNILCYAGGDTRILVVNRHTSLPDFSLHLSKTLLQGSSFVLKYQLPEEDLDTLISVITDEDLQSMIEEYDRINAIPSTGRTVRLRLFLFPLKSDPKSLTGSIWFLDALKGLTSISRKVCSELPSVNSLLGLDDDITNGIKSGQEDAVRNRNNSEDGLRNGNNIEQSQVLQYQIPNEDQDSITNEEDAENTIDEYDGISTISRNTASTWVRMLRSLSRSNSMASSGSGATKSDDGYFNRHSALTTVATSTPTIIFSDTSSVKSLLGADDDFVSRGAVIPNDDWVWLLPWNFWGRASMERLRIA